ncbi:MULTISPECIES: BREX system P-loop protein BrxC [Thiorhodovibrio]|uniref:BREX system P-loop protein BrxC n=1 Tax=Thiorhodovibrio TaxID=61593 RepID=UPI00191443C7|nr:MULTISPECIES: BREX system P-loop protein BrxC [Thiorhodovibrio]MBK5968366.1 ATPase [Thiorhodovibrio winogradskyi]WPL13182.1 hypothetical protein Thiosp_02976 [Thiorhodovibrio litoralis]
MDIKQLFDSSKDIYRTIEKVITYGVAQETRLKAEISEYVVTDSIEEQLEKLLDKMEAAMEAGGENEVGIWVSGFYGSGKSSFTKYLGLAFDDRVTIDGLPFLHHLQNRLKKSTTKARIAAVAKKYPAAVLMLDLASEQVAGATMEEVSTVLYYKVLQWGGYSRNLKVAAFERRAKQDGRHDEFLNLFGELTQGQAWADYRNDDLVVDSVMPELAHRMYPHLFRTPGAFSTETSEIIRFENDRVAEMIEIAREASGRDYIIFVVDEVGQYVGSRQNLILNLDGLGKNLKAIGNGKVLFIGTAQQRLTEDDASAALNSQQLFKLKDRFPIQIDLEASDIKEICTNRLLGKSPTGEAEVGRLFDQHGQSLRHHTKLEDARAYGADFDRQTFIDLYPFLPAHFDILLHLLGALAKSTGGIGLRSAIKVIQDILVEGPDGKTPIANQPLGWLATTVTLFDALERDIRRAFPSWHQAVGKVKIRFPDAELHQQIGKSICVLQILGNLPISRHNVASLMHPSVASPALNDRIEPAIEDLLKDTIVPLGEKDGVLAFHSEKLNEIEQERAKIPLRAIELRRVRNEALQDTYTPLPATQLNNTFSVTTGLKAQSASGIPASLTGDRNPIQTLVELVEPSEYETAKIRLSDESRQPSAKQTIFLLGRDAPEMNELVSEIVRGREIVNKYRNDPDQEVKDYCNAQSDRAARLLNQLGRQIGASLTKGSFIFRGELSAVDSFNQDLIEAARKHLAKVAAQVFDRHAEAPVRASTDLAEKFLRQGNLAGMTAQIDPLGLVKLQGGQGSIDTQHKALTSIRDQIERQGSLEGKRLSDLFADAPFGWSPDTLRYLVAALLVAGEIKLKLAGREITVNGQQAIDALKTNTSFKSVGISLRDNKPSMEMLARAAQRLTSLAGDSIVPLEDIISKTTAKLFSDLQHQFAPLAATLRSLDLPGAERLDQLASDIKAILATDASDAVQRLGAETSELFDSLEWARSLKQAMTQGLETTLDDLRRHLRDIHALPSHGTPGHLRQALGEPMADLEQRLQHPDFYKYATDFASSLTELQTQVRDAVKQMQHDQAQRLRDAEDDLGRLPEWPELSHQDRNNALADLHNLASQASEDLTGLRDLINQEYSIQNEVQDIKNRIHLRGQQILQERLRAEQEQAVKDGQATICRQQALKARITSIQDLDRLIRDLQQLRGELQYAAEFELKIDLEPGTLR